MSSYISSNANRFYVALESTYGQAAGVSSSNRFPAVRLAAHQSLEAGRRQDKTGTRTFLGVAKSSRRKTEFEIRTYLTSWTGTGVPSYGPLFEAALGGIPESVSSLTIASVLGTTSAETTAAHGLNIGSAISFSNEIRFVTGVPDAMTFTLNAPFTTPLQSGAVCSPSITYRVANSLPSATIYDYWDPTSAASRLIAGAAVDAMEIAINGDFHEFTFAGPAADLVDSQSFAATEAGLSSFPSEPAQATFDYSVVPGHLGEVWMGDTVSQFFTLVEADVQVRNNLKTRSSEFGSSLPRAVVPGSRQVSLSFNLFAQDDSQTLALAVAAKQRNTVPAMLQLGQQQGQLMAIFLPQVTPEIPNFDGSESRLKWQFQNNLAQGSGNDEIYIAFA